MMKKLTTICISLIGVFVLTIMPAFAHVIVTPHQVGIAATQDFTVNVPNEKDNPISSVRLLIPDGVTSVVPNTAPGWTIATKSSGSGDNATVTEIDWTGGSIPVGQRQEFVFNAQVPAKPTTLNWKAYQTYSDGTIVSWDIDPNTMKNVSDADQDKMADQQNKGVYSTTTVINDLTGANPPTMTGNNPDSTTLADLAQKVTWDMYVTGAAIILSLVAIGMQLMKKK